MKPLLQIIVTATRPGRKGPVIADWLKNYAIADGRFEVELVDIADLDLPLFDEPNHPHQHDYQHEHTKRWSEIANRGDAYIFAVPEYDSTPSSSFINAVTYLSLEWQYKGVAFLGYGGVSGGARAISVARNMMIAVRSVPIADAINIPNYFEHLDENGGFNSNHLIDHSAKTVLDELFKVEHGLKLIREKFGTC